MSGYIDEKSNDFENPVKFFANYLIFQNKILYEHNIVLYIMLLYDGYC